VYGKTTAQTTKMMLAIIAIFFSFPSKLFLLPYSPDPPPHTPATPIPNQPFGDISKIDHTITIPLRIRTVINNHLMFYTKKSKHLYKTMYFWDKCK
jgi:hypothetical protein